jgi:hypothetical protein
VRRPAGARGAAPGTNRAAAHALRRGGGLAGRGAARGATPPAQARCARSPQPTPPRCARPPKPPSSRPRVPQVAAACASRFEALTARRGGGAAGDGAIPLAKACLLLALEEEAAAASEPRPAGGGSGGGPGALSGAGAATWSLSRLDALADEALAHFAAHHAPGPGGGSSGGGGGGRSSGLPGAVQGGLGAFGRALARALPRPRWPGAGAGGLAPGAARALAARFPLAALTSVNAVLFERHGYAACNRWGGARCAAAAAGPLAAGPRLPWGCGSAPGRQSAALPPAAPPFAALTQPAPARPRSDSQLSSVLERGSGSAVALCILYTSVCARAGLDLHARVLRDGPGGAYYAVAWPAAGPLTGPGGVRCVVDVYGRGGLLTVDEVCDLFGVTPDALLSPSPRRRLLAALLGELLAAHWAAACGCPPSPAARLPLAPAAALGGAVTRLDGGPLARAAAAAAKRVALLPRSQEARMELGLIHYFSGRYDDAFLELGILMEQAAAVEAAAAAAPQSGSPGAAAVPEDAAEAEDALPPGVLADAALLLEKLRLELLVAA